MNWKWSSYDEFERKYGSDNNPDAFAKRQSIFMFFNSLGKQLKVGLVDRETLYFTVSNYTSWTWEKFKGIIVEQRRRYPLGKDFLIGFEYVAVEMLKMKLEMDPEYKIPENFTQYIPDK